MSESAQGAVPLEDMLTDDLRLMYPDAHDADVRSAAREFAAEALQAARGYDSITEDQAADLAERMRERLGGGDTPNYDQFDDGLSPSSDSRDVEWVGVTVGVDA